MKLLMPKNKIDYYANRYNYPTEHLIEGLYEKAQMQGFITKKQLEDIAAWKAPRSVRHVFSNDSRMVEETTHFAFSSGFEKVRIESLLILHGVAWPTASVILHLCHKDSYPILDFRALWSVSTQTSYYNYNFWVKYTNFCRDLSKELGIDMRTLDKALWQYSKEHQKKA